MDEVKRRARRVEASKKRKEWVKVGRVKKRGKGSGKRVEA